MNIEQTLEKFITEELMMSNATKLDPDQSLLDSGIIDSLSLLRVIAFIEDTFGVQVDDTELSPSNFETINMMVSMIESKQNHH